MVNNYSRDSLNYEPLSTEYFKKFDENYGIFVTKYSLKPFSGKYEDNEYMNC